MERIKKVTTDDLAIMINDGFKDVDKKFEKIETELKIEIKKSEQKMMDYTNKRIGESEGKIIPKINALTNILKDKNIINEDDVRKVKFAVEVEK